MVPRLLRPRPRRVIRAAPAVVEVARLDERAIGLLPARRRDVETLPRLQVAPRGEHMHVHAAVGVAVPHRRPGVAIRIQPGPGGLLERVEHPVDCLVARLVLDSPGDHARRVFVVERQRVGRRGHLVWVPTQHRHVVPHLALAVQLAREVVNRGLDRARAAGKELNQHRPRPARAIAPARARWLPGGRGPRRPLGRPGGCAPSARSWFRFEPMRAICRVRSRSTARAGAVQVCVRAMAWRSSADSDTPAAAALACQAASSSALTRA